MRVYLKRSQQYVRLRKKESIMQQSRKAVLVFLFLSLSFFLYANVCIRTQQSCNPTDILHTAIRFVSLYACTKRLACCYLIEFLEKFGQTGGEKGKSRWEPTGSPVYIEMERKTGKARKRIHARSNRQSRWGNTRGFLISGWSFLVRFPWVNRNVHFVSCDWRWRLFKPWRTESVFSLITLFL